MTDTSTREPLVGLAERLREVTQADREAAADLLGWEGAYPFYDDRPAVQAFARHRATALEEQSRGRLQDDMQLWRTAAAWAVTFQAAHGRPPSVDDATEAARTALSPSDKGEKP